LTLSPLLVVCAMQDGEGDLLTRMLRTFPDCSGVLSGEYAGDGWAFLQRARFLAGPVEGIVLTEKDRGESWGDLVAGGLAWSPDGTVSRVTAGWLDPVLGSGLVLGGTGSWGAGGSFLEAKPPSSRTSLDPAGSASESEGMPLTGAGVQLDALGIEAGLVQCVTRIDPAGTGLHRTESELDARGSLDEVLSAGRIAIDGVGASFARASGSAGRWTRAGIDLDIDLSGTGLSGEAAIGSAGGTGVGAFWAAVHEETGGLRFCLSAYSFPPDFPDRRSSQPMGGTCDFGTGAGTRWRFGPGWLAAGSVSCEYLDGDGKARADLEIRRRLPGGVELRLSGRTCEDAGVSSSRLLGALSWDIDDDFGIDASLQATGSAEDGSRGTGSAGETRIRWRIAEPLELRAAAAAFSTDGYGSRVYCGELGFPGEFASAQLWGEGFLLQASVSIEPVDGVELRLRAAMLEREGADVIGTGFESTDGPVRTEVGAQLEVPL
jgi:hypothetical protein